MKRERQRKKKQACHANARIFILVPDVSAGIFRIGDA